jgi:2,3-bisphosphoglycerate-independent phosphoglycerate mutase
MAVSKKPVVLVVFDGWGVAPPSRGNAIDMAKTPIYDECVASCPTTILQSSGDAVGLPFGEMGNSEVGHLSLGTGRIIYQNLPRIMKAISDGTFYKNKALLQAVQTARKKNSTLHVMGMFSSGGVHSSNEHGYALLELCAQQGLKDVAVHAFLDGRDTPRDSGRNFIEKLQTTISKLGLGRIATIAGRYYAMDRDNRWDRIEKCYRAMVFADGPTAVDPLAAIDASYKKGVYDEEFLPTIITQDKQAVTQIKNEDVVVFFNFRPDRARQLTKALALPGFEKFDRGDYLKHLLFVTMTEYEKDLPVEIAYPPQQVKNSLARVLSDAGFHQLHLAETEKYAHVTFFFNGGLEAAWPGEERVLIPSPMVTSYDQKPAMSARDLTDRLIKELDTGHYDFIVVNFANADMVGHTGNIEATVEAIEVLDEALGRIIKATLSINGAVVITADHGNAEDKINPQTGQQNKEHTANPVPFILVAKEWQREPAVATVGHDMSATKSSGVLADVAPTVLEIMGITKPADMTGQSLLSLMVPPTKE